MTTSIPTRNMRLSMLLVGSLVASCANFSDDGYDVDEMQEFVSAESEFYPEFERLYRLRIARWAAEQNAKCARVPGRLP